MLSGAPGRSRAIRDLVRKRPCVALVRRARMFIRVPRTNVVSPSSRQSGNPGTTRHVKIDEQSVVVSFAIAPQLGHHQPAATACRSRRRRRRAPVRPRRAPRSTPSRTVVFSHTTVVTVDAVQERRRARGRRRQDGDGPHDRSKSSTCWPRAIPLPRWGDRAGPRCAIA